MSKCKHNARKVRHDIHWKEASNIKRCVSMQMNKYEYRGQHTCKQEAHRTAPRVMTGVPLNSVPQLSNVAVQILDESHVWARHIVQLLNGVQRFDHALDVVEGLLDLSSRATSTC